MKNTTQKGTTFELKIADFYRQLGAKKVEHNVGKEGNQIDLYVEMACLDGCIHRIAVEAKNLEKTVGIEIVNKFSIVVQSLKNADRIDQGVIVSNKGFSRQAREGMKAHNIKALVLDDLKYGVSNVEDKSNFYNTVVTRFKADIKNLLDDVNDISGKPLPQPYEKTMGAIGGIIAFLITGLLVGLSLLDVNETSQKTIIVLGSFASVAFLLGSIQGWRLGLKAWLPSLFIIDIAHFGSITGATIGGLVSSVNFATSYDGLFTGALIGFVQGLLLRPRFVEAIRKDLKSSLHKEIIRTIFGLLMGPIFGAFYGYIMVKLSLSNQLKMDTLLDGLVLGAMLGLFTSILISTLIVMPILAILFDTKKQ